MERKRIAVALAAIAIVGLFAGGSVYAYFSDTETIGGKFEAGTLILTVGESTATLADIGPVYPGWGTSEYGDSISEATQTITVSNGGSINGDLKLTIKVTENSGALGEHLRVSVNYDGVDILLPTKIINAGSISLGDLNVGDKDKPIVIKYYVPSSVGNEIQDSSVSFDLIFTLDQDRVAAV